MDYKPGDSVTGASPNIRRVRLGLGGNVAVGASNRADPARSIGVAWQTDDGTTASDLAIGADPDPTKWDPKSRLTGTTWNTPPGTLNPAGPERMHEAYACGLAPSTTYYYRVGGGPMGQEQWSDVFAFTTTPAAGDGSVKIAVTGDSRGENGNAWQILQRQVKAMAPTIQLFSGDMIDFGTDQGEWGEWLDRAAKDEAGKASALSSVLTLAAHGNHDNHSTLFYANLVLPQDLTAYPQYAELFFSVDVGPVHVVVLDDYFIGPVPQPDYMSALGDWLSQDLTAANANRAKVPWIVAMHHHPSYSSSTHGKDKDVIKVRQFVTPIWDKFHVDLAISGHDHDYERTKPLTGPADNPMTFTDPSKGTVYLTCAGSGADGYGAGTSSFTAMSQDYKSGGLGLYGVITATQSSLQIDAHTLTAAGDNPQFDTFTITK